MKTGKDIRDRVDIRSEDITGLNFIRDAGRYVFRRHYRQGLRSRIMEVLDADDVRKESLGQVVDGLRVFPRARPIKMLRIFTSRFDRLETALKEARMYRVIEEYLGADHVAASSEFIVTYLEGGRRDILLCGLQDYVEGEILDPWGFGCGQDLEELCRRMSHAPDNRRDSDVADRVRKARKSAESLVGRLKRMVLEAGYIPDLSGIGNLILTPSGNLTIVDINNISRVIFDPAIRTDNKGYPVCDKSVEVMAILERELLGRAADPQDPVYGHFLTHRRMAEVKSVEERFYRSWRP